MGIVPSTGAPQTACKRKSVVLVSREQQHAYRNWLVKRRRMSEGSAKDYAWSVSKGPPSDKRSNVQQAAKPLLNEFAQSSVGKGILKTSARNSDSQTMCGM